MTALNRIAAIATAAELDDGAAPLDEATWFALRQSEGVQQWLREGAFALLRAGELSLVVHPDQRRQGLGGSLLDEVLAAASGSVQAWSHCDHPAAARLADRHGFERVRELWVMRRPASAPLPEDVTPDGVTIRGFEPGDEDELIRVNAAAFASHAEQGAMDEANLTERMEEPWFDPTGLLVAVDSGDRMSGFHWTKQHSADVGEVYVVGIDPEAQGLGLGKTLTLAGLRHLGAIGVREVKLYVESDNAPAIGVYSGLGFTHAAADTHVMYRR